jgi:coenzyme F420-0:L-glutamate ligase/coenzyme F420-1:gamma-L-glutamate ligase
VTPEHGGSEPANPPHSVAAGPVSLEILPVPGIGEVSPGTDLAGAITRAAPWLRDGDVLVVTSKVVSKAEGRLVAVPPSGPERDDTRAAVIAGETARVVATRGETRIVATHHGFVMASAGVDASNVDPGHLVLLPKDPDASARALRAALAERYGLRVAVVVSDTSGRPWRNGLTDVALGAAGIEPLRDHRGQADPYGNELRVTQVAVADELAAAADLVKGKHDRIPVAVVRCLPAGAGAGDDPAGGMGAGEDGPGVVGTLVRDGAQDLFALGTAEARAAGLREAATLAEVERFGPEPVDPAAVARAVAAVATGLTRMTVVREPGGPVAVRCDAPDPTDPAALVRLGADVHRLRAALAADGLGSATRFAEPGTVLVLAGTFTTGCCR